MSACIILARATDLKTKFSDAWEGLQLSGPAGWEDAEPTQPEEGNIQILGDFSWDKLQLSLHQATTKSMLNIVQKMYEFVMQQKRRSERTISMMLPSGSAASKALQAYREEQKRAEESKEGTQGQYFTVCYLRCPVCLVAPGLLTPFCRTELFYCGIYNMCEGMNT